MNGGAGVTKESHCFRVADSCPMCASNGRYSSAVKANMRQTNLAEKASPVASGVPHIVRRKVPRIFCAAAFEPSQHWNEDGIQRRLEDFPALGSKQDASSSKIHLAQTQPRFLKPAALCHRNVETYAHPFGADRELPANEFFLVECDFGFFSCRDAAEAEPATRVHNGESAANRLVHDNPENFDLQEDGSWSDFSALFLSIAPPVEIRHNRAVIHADRGYDSDVVKESFDGLPDANVTLICKKAGRLFRIVAAIKIRAHPSRPTATRVNGSGLLFLKCLSCAQLTSRASLRTVAPPVRSCLQNPSPGNGMAISQSPILRVRPFGKRSHRKQRKQISKKTQALPNAIRGNQSDFLLRQRLTGSSPVRPTIPSPRLFLLQLRQR